MKQRFGSEVNSLMGNSKDTTPEVGKGATIMLWTDRHAYEVMKVSEDKTKATIQRYEAERTDDNGMSDSQQYKYEKLGRIKKEIAFQWGKWRHIQRDENGKIVRNPINIMFGVKHEYHDYSF